MSREGIVPIGCGYNLRLLPLERAAQVVFEDVQVTVPHFVRAYPGIPLWQVPVDVSSARDPHSPRHFAFTEMQAGVRVQVTQAFASLPPAIRHAMLAHEFGHVIDYLVPPRHRRSADQIELDADAIAERVMRRPIWYVGPCLLQSFTTDGTGLRPRPRGLR